MGDEIKIEREESKVVTPVVETESRLTAPLIEHEGRVTRIEDQQSRYQEDMIRKLGELETQLQSASGARFTVLEEKIAALEGRIHQEAPIVPAVPDTSVELSLPEVENSPEPPERVRQGMRHRRKAKKKRIANA